MKLANLLTGKPAGTAAGREANWKWSSREQTVRRISAYSTRFLKVLNNTRAFLVHIDSHHSGVVLSQCRQQLVVSCKLDIKLNRTTAVSDFKESLDSCEHSYMCHSEATWYTHHDSVVTINQHTMLAAHTWLQIKSSACCSS